ncbi:MAG: hypothetical protein LBH35_00645 [Treponema sp.]|nr:hypothetical protein [Treponema sp.]
MSAALQSALVLRRRSGWEASDTGILLWQKNMPALLCFYGVPLGIVTACGFFLPVDAVMYFGFVLWWLKPLFDRLALHVIALRFFRPASRLPRLFRGLGKSLIRGIAGDLLWRRFSPCRSSRMPLIVLEGLKGPALKKRRDLMNPRGLDFGFPVTLACLVLNTVLTYGELAFIYGIFELIQPGYLGGIWEYYLVLTKFTLPLSWINQIFIETLYVCMGFGIYINSRVETEGWDIELLFKKCTEKAGAGRFALKPGLKPAVTGAVLCLALASLLVPARAFAEEGLPAAGKPELFVPAPLSEESAEELREILSSEDFGNEKPGWKIQFKGDKGDEEPVDSDSDLDITWRELDFPWLKEVLGIAIRTIIILAAAFALVWSAVYFYRHRGAFSRKKRSAAYGIRSGAADPGELLKQAAAFHAEGRTREAWALCFRAFIASFSIRGGIVFPSGATEYEAVALAGTQNGEFSRFVSRWISFAYGGRVPEEGAFDQSVGACRRLLEDRPPAEKETS